MVGVGETEVEQHLGVHFWIRHTQSLPLTQ